MHLILMLVGHKSGTWFVILLVVLCILSFAALFTWARHTRGIPPAAAPMHDPH